MTCIAGYIEQNGDIYMGGDSIGIIGSDYLISKDPKVFIRRNMIFGFTSSFRMGDILKYDFDIPDHDPKISTNEYLTSIFLVDLLERYEERKFLQITDNVAMSGIFLLGYDKRLFRVESDFCIIEDVKNYAAAGCGQDFTKAILYSLEDSGLTAEEKITKSMIAAAEFSMVKEPFLILKLPANSGLNLKDPKKKTKKKKLSKEDEGKIIIETILETVNK